MLVCLQGCYSSVVDYFELYIYVAGALAIVVLTIEVRRFSFSHYIFRFFSASLAMWMSISETKNSALS